ncbi:taperin [Ornithorhynchus anatinus]|uniref:taperin n=1 Tax=Ornithorhynchus anatinus TaxID=9258 RepID=UPI0019D4B70C|nr:taperin [Ornithorhynchus anatinus]
MKISFNEKSLETTFEYPSENSLGQDANGQASGSDEEDEEEEKSLTLILPRATFANSSGSDGASHPPELNSGLSSYTPKHSGKFDKWRVRTFEESLVETREESSAEPPGREVMLTPASPNDLSDFRSEPALYF